MNMHDFTYSVAGTQICQLPLVCCWLLLGVNVPSCKATDYNFLLYAVKTDRCGAYEITHSFLACMHSTNIRIIEIRQLLRA